MPITDDITVQKFLSVAYLKNCLFAGIQLQRRNDPAPEKGIWMSQVSPMLGDDLGAEPQVKVNQCEALFPLWAIAF